MELNEAKKQVADLKVRIAELGTEAHEKRLEGRETNQINQPLFFIYDDGTVEKKIIIE